MRPTILALLAACSPRAVTPPARTFVLDSPVGPSPAHADAQFDFARVGGYWGPQLIAGNARAHFAASDHVVIEGNAGWLREIDHGADADHNDRDAYTGRLGALLQLGDHCDALAIGADDHCQAIAIGAGGGASGAAGPWATADAGWMIAAGLREARVVMGAGLGYSAPLSSRSFTVTDEQGSATTLQLPHNLFVHYDIGAELGRPRGVALAVGLSMLFFQRFTRDVVDPSLDNPSSGAMFVAIGGGARVGFE